MKNYLLVLGLVSVISLQGNAQSLVSITPNMGTPGATNLVTQITGVGTTFQGSSPQGTIIDVNLDLAGGNIIYGDFLSIAIIDDQNFTIEWDIPGAAPVGQYDLNVTYEDWSLGFPNWMYLTLPSSFQVGVPDGYVQGRIFNDVNENGVQDAGDLGLAGYSVTLNPGAVTMQTNASGDYSIPAQNGNYTLNYDGYTIDQKIVVPGFLSAIPVIINNANDSANNFPVTQGLVSVYPDSAFQGQVIYITVTGKGCFSTVGGANGNISSARLYKAPTSITANSTKINVIDSNTAVIQFSIPSNATLGMYDFRVYLTSGYLGYHYLNGVFKIVTAPIYMNGICFFDADSNGVQGAGEGGVSNAELFLSPDSAFAFTDVNGNYSFGTVPGTHTISFVPGSYTLSPGSPPDYTATVSTTTSGYDFGLFGNDTAYSATINFEACWSGCAHPNCFRYKIQNTGTVAYDGYVYMVLDSINMTNTNQYQWCWAGSNFPDSVIGDTVFWNFTNLQPLQQLILSASINTPLGGDTINFSGTVVTYYPGNLLAYSRTTTDFHVVSCSFDPNDKSVRPAGILPQHYTLMSDSLVYTVQFQNTGTDTAYTVIVRDTIDQNLDLSTMQVILSSHPMITEIDLMTRVAKFTFNNILLVDSTHNEPASHGYFKYLIRPEAGLPDNTVIYNDADIYFDFNPPVITNTVFNTLVYTLPVGITELKGNAGDVLVIPNPFSSMAVIKFSNTANFMYTFNLFTVDGKEVYRVSTKSDNIKLQKGKLQSGMYLFKLAASENAEVIKFGKIIIE